MPVQFNLPPMLLLGPLLAAVVVYVVLRWVIWAPGTGTSPQSVSQHGLWVGVIGWLASSLQGAMNLGLIPAGPATRPYLVTPDAIMPALGWPVLGCLAVHALGQITYPGPRRARRQAILSVRKIGDFLPGRLAWTTAGIFLGAAACIAWTAMLPGFAPVPPVTVGEEPYTYQSAGGEGRIPGLHVAGWLGGALLVLLGGTWLVLRLIARRRQLESLDAGDNALLRTIAMNRLLRTVATVAAGLAAIAGNFATKPDPALPLPTTWMNPAGLAASVVLLSMWCWRPPRLTAAGLGERNRPESGLAAGPRHPAVRLVSSLGALLGFTAAVPLVAGILFAPALIAVASFGIAGIVALMAGLVLLVIAAGELLLQRNYGTPEAPRTWPRQPVSPALLATAVLAVLVYAAAIVGTAAGQARLAEDPGWIPSALLTACVAAASLPAFLIARRREAVHGLPAGVDAALRAITIHRTARTLAAALTAQAALLLLTQSHAWAAVLVASSFGDALNPSAGSWWPASLAGAVLGAVATVIAVIPITTPAQSRTGTGPLRQNEPVT
jgi:hypothetical protein